MTEKLEYSAADMASAAAGGWRDGQRAAAEAAQSALAGEREAVEVRGLQWMDTGHYRKQPPKFDYNPHEWNPLMLVSQHERILAAQQRTQASHHQGEVQRLREEVRKIAVQCSCEATTDRLDALLAASTGQDVEK